MLSSLLLALVGQSVELAEPFQVRAGARPIELNIGHAAPLFTDFDKDGLNDLLVGEFGGGKIRFYKNLGSRTQPRFDKFEFVKAGGKEISVEAG